MEDKPTFIVMADRIGPEKREAIHAIVKEHSSGWWHHFANVWIVRGHSATFWRDALIEHLGSPSAVLVMSLPPKDATRWAYYGSKAQEKAEWLHKYL